MTTVSPPLLRLEEKEEEQVLRSHPSTTSMSLPGAPLPLLARRTISQWVLGGVVVATWLVASLLLGKAQTRTPTTTRIAFVGNSFQFVNDFPRVLTALAEASSRKIHFEEDSVLHGNLSLVSLLQRGNGMRIRWKSEQAWNATAGVYEYGACTVPQLLVGRDDYLLLFSNKNNDDDDGNNNNFNNYFEEFYMNDGFNPCFVDDDDDPGDVNYLEYTLETKMVNNSINTTSASSQNKKTWDFVVLNDQSVRPAIPGKRQVTVQVLASTYLPLLQECGAVPIFIATHGYWRDGSNINNNEDDDDAVYSGSDNENHQNLKNLTDLYGIQDVPHFTAKLHRGYLEYAQALVSVQPRVAPVGIAFLVVWEENPTLWARLFGPDQFHPSPLGTYLMGCVVHATMFGRLPDAPSTTTATSSSITTEGTSATVGANPSVTDPFFAHCRAMGLSSNTEAVVLPTFDEALYLRWIAKRVVFRNYQPRSFWEAWKLVDDEEGEMQS